MRAGVGRIGAEGGRIREGSANPHGDKLSVKHIRGIPS